MRIQILIFGVKGLNKREYWDKEGILGHWPGYVNFPADIFRGCNGGLILGVSLLISLKKSLRTSPESTFN